MKSKANLFHNVKYFNEALTLSFLFHVNPFQPSVAFHIETSHLFCRAKQITGFYMKCNTGLKWV